MMKMQNHNMKSLFTVFAFLISACGTHNYSPISLRSVNKTGSKIKVLNQNDTISIGDTIGLEFVLPNPVRLDDSSDIIIKNITNTSIGYHFRISNKPTLNMFSGAGEILEKSKSYSQSDGRFYFNTLLMPLLGTTIHFVPSDTGTYILDTQRFQYLTCEVEGSSDKIQINFNPEFDVPDIHGYLLDKYPAWQIGMSDGKKNEATPYYCFYVKPK
jgi:hypothetical protein